MICGYNKIAPHKNIFIKQKNLNNQHGKGGKDVFSLKSTEKVRHLIVIITLIIIIIISFIVFFTQYTINKNHIE